MAKPPNLYILMIKVIKFIAFPVVFIVVAYAAMLTLEEYSENALLSIIAVFLFILLCVNVRMMLKIDSIAREVKK